MNKPEWPAQVAAVYVICNLKKEKARWDRLLPHLLTRGIPPERIRVSAPCWGADMTPAELFSMYDPFLPRPRALTFKGAGLTRGEISLGVNMATAFRDACQRAEAAADPDSSLIMVLESDVWLRDDFVPRLRDLLAAAEAKGSWDFISLGEGVGTRPPGCAPSYYAPTQVYPSPHFGAFRCTDSMLFTLPFLRRLTKTIPPFREIIDWEMNYQLVVNKGVALWADPPLAEQGTCRNRMATSLPA